MNWNYPMYLDIGGLVFRSSLGFWRVPKRVSAPLPEIRKNILGPNSRRNPSCYRDCGEVTESERKWSGENNPLISTHHKHKPGWAPGSVLNSLSDSVDSGSPGDLHSHCCLSTLYFNQTSHEYPWGSWRGSTRWHVFCGPITSEEGRRRGHI